MKKGPYKRDRILLCSADAGPHSQRDRPCEAGFFFPGAKWVGAMRNRAERLGCDFAILTTGHGMVRPWDIIEPYDMHVDEFRDEVKAIWEKTVPRFFAGKPYDILLFYAGGCPRKPMLELLLPILEEHRVPLMTFGRPMMFDFDKVDAVVGALVRGTTCEEIKAILHKPERLEFYPSCGKGREPAKQESDAKKCASGPKRVLFDENGSPLHPMFIMGCVSCFTESYQKTVREVITDSTRGLSRDQFVRNVARVMVSFKMTRQGPFRGVKFKGDVIDPSGLIERCWSAVGKGVLELRNFLDRTNKKSRARALLEVPAGSRERVIEELDHLFLELLPICSTKNTKGRVGASKVLFAVLPEVAQPVDNTQWRKVFRTKEYEAVLQQISEETKEWEKKSKKRLDACDPAFPVTTIPAVYNVMAMKARKDPPINTRS